MSLPHTAPPLSLAHYGRLVELSRTAHSVTFRAVAADGRPVLLKYMLPGANDASTARRLRREYEILRELHLPEVIHARELFETPGGCFLESEDPGGVPLRTLVLRQLDLGSFLTHGLQVARALSVLHGRGLSHHGLTPDNIFCDAEARVVFADLELATGLTWAASPPAGIGEIEGALAYISPEQTGRMNRPVDRRADLYSLGVVLHELCAGTPPFLTTDPLELVHATVAQMPLPLATLRPEVPIPVSDLVTRLLSKMADDRPPSATSVVRELEHCLAEWTASGRVAPYPAGSFDVSDQFVIPRKLYGRGEQLDALLQAVESARRGAPVTVTVAGSAGLGKTMLVHELTRSLVERGGVFAEGKFDQLRRALPYGSILEAVQDLVRRILGASEAELDRHRIRLRAAVGEDADLLREVVPDLELITGRTTGQRVRTPEEIRARMHFILRALLKVFHSPEQPLVVFLDDVQWADLASLEFLAALLAGPEPDDPVLILSFRSDEVDDTHPLATILRRRAPETLVRLEVGPIGRDDVAALLVDALACEKSAAEELATLVVEKTAGNPFFVHEFLTTLARQGQLRFEPDVRAWTWDLPRVRQLHITANVADLLAQRIRQLSPEAQSALSVGGCMGSRFDLEILAQAEGLPVQAVARSLREAVLAGLLISTDDTWNRLQDAVSTGSVPPDAPVRLTFPHDRVQQAAQQRLSEKQQHRVRLALGRVLEQRLGASLDERIFEVADHFDAALPLLESGEERLRVAKLNLAAGGRARASAAFDAALTYFEAGLSLLPSDAWEQHAQLAFGLHVEAAGVALMCPSRASAVRYAEEARRRSTELLDRVAAQNVLIKHHFARGEHQAVVDCTLEALAWLGFDLPRHPSQARVTAELVRARFQLRGRDLVSLRALPRTTDQKIAAATALMIGSASAAYFVSPNLLMLLVLRAVTLPLQHGVTPSSAVAYISYALILIATRDDYASATLYATFARELVQRSEATELAVQLKVEDLSLALIDLKSKPFAAVSAGFEAVLHRAAEAGDAELVAIVAYATGHTALLEGRELSGLDARLSSLVKTCERINQARGARVCGMLRQIVANLRGAAANPGRIDGEHLNRAVFDREVAATSDHTSVAAIRIYECMLQFLFGTPAEAVRRADEADGVLRALPGGMELLNYHFFSALARLSLAQEQPDQPALRLLQQARRSLELIRGWAVTGPANFLGRQKLLEAELAIAEGRTEEAAALFEEAADEARNGGLVHDQALALERAARFYLARRQLRSGQAHLREARRAWAEWGAGAKVAQLDALARELALPAALTDAEGPAFAVDAASIFKAARALSGETQLARLLERLMRVVMENAGADCGLLALEHDGVLRVFARVVGTRGKVEVFLPDGAPFPDPTIPYAAAAVRYVARKREALVLGDASRVARLEVIPSGRPPQSVLCAPLLQSDNLVGVVYLENGLARDAFTAGRLMTVSVLAAQAATSIEVARLHDSLRESLATQTRLTHAYGQFMPQQFLEQLQKNSILDVRLGDQVEREVTVVFTDIHRFSALTQQLGPAQTFTFLNGLLGYIEPAIHQHGGYINQYLGDGIMALFPKTADDGIRGGIEVQAAVERFNEKRRSAGEEPILLGVGINTGTLMLGAIGGPDRMDRGTIGDAVNQASRLEGMTRIFGAPLIIGDATVSRLADQSEYALRPLGRVLPAGFQAPLGVYEVIEGNSGAMKAGKLSTLQTFREAMALWRDGDVALALLQFEECVARHPEDEAARFYAQRCHRARALPRGAPWSDVVILNTK